jgi:hypothetical protein
MNIIQKALKKQNIDVAWSGPIPSNVNKITKAYLEGLHDGFPRMVRSDDDTGIHVVLKQLKTDFKELHDDERVALIKSIASKIILIKYPAFKQMNMISRSILLSNSSSLSDEENTELDNILAAWQWINDVRMVSNLSESDTNLAINEIIWPT